MIGKSLSTLSLALVVLLLTGCELTGNDAASNRDSQTSEKRTVPPKNTQRTQAPVPKTQPPEPIEEWLVTNNFHQSRLAGSKTADYEIIRYQKGDKYIDKVLLTTDILFAFDSSTINRNSKAVIDGVLKTFFTQLNNQYIYVVGHTDSDGNDAYNVGLSLRRATAVLKTLQSHDVMSDKVFVIPAGKHMPLVPNSSTKNKSLNRRVELYVSPWADVAPDLIRRWKCPESACSYAAVSILPVSRDFSLDTKRRDLTVPATIRPMQVEHEQRGLKLPTAARQPIELPITVRELTLPTKIRPLPRIGANSRADERDPIIQYLIKKLKQ